MSKILVCGVSGRMGSRIASLIQERKDLELLPIDHESSALISKTLRGALVRAEIKDYIQQAQVIIDFTTPAATIQFLKSAINFKTPMVIGTTGLSEAERNQILEASQKIPIVLSSNMSMGVNVMWKLIADAAKALGSDYDIEVLEMHHRHKKDAPSGTAMTTAEVLAEASGRNLAKDAIYARHGIMGERKTNEIGIQTLRGGDVVGDHTVYFAGIGERLEITHRATSRDTFAQGALRAAEWLIGKTPGLYDMQDVLGLK